jgi:hypothetical protein
MRRLAALTLLVLVGSCIPQEGPMMDPFQDCLACHSSGGDARTWTAAGTWFKGSRIEIVDSNGKTISLRGNRAGNFYTAEGLAFPITIAVDGVVMAASTSPTTPLRSVYGGCNACHHAWAVTTGPNMAPGTDCLHCHGPSGFATTKFVAAGTFPPAGRTVRVGSCPPKTTNAVGNFYILASECTIPSWPTSASVDASQMPNGAPYGGCNAAGCHGPSGNAGD